MAFIEIQPSRNKTSKNSIEKIRVSFPKRKDNKHTMIMYIGKNVANKIGINKDDKIKFYIDDENDKTWMIKKSNDDIGYKVLNTEDKKGKKSDILKIQMTWRGFKPKESDIPIKTVEYIINDGGIVVFYK